MLVDHDQLRSFWVSNLIAFRSHLFLFDLAYLMKYRHMSLREAFYYLRSRRSIIGPNFGFIKQVNKKETNKISRHN